MTLWVGGLILVVGLILASLATSHIQLTSRLESALQAESIAEAAIAQALERLIADPEYGVRGEAEAGFSVEMNGGRARLSFHPETCEEWEIPLSESNRFNIEPIVAEDGSLLPARSVRLVAVGEVGGVKRTVEVILNVPEFPYAIASSGPVESDGSLVVGSVHSLEEFEEGLVDEELQPGDLVSNRSVALSGNALITGTVRSHGSVTTTDEVEVVGRIQEHADLVELLDIDVNSLRPEDSTPLTGEMVDVHITDARHFNDPSLIIEGGLTLQQGVLYVNGDLHVRGGLRGEGALLVNGDVILEGGASFAADEQVAVVANGNVTVMGAGQESSVFQGLIYTEGELLAEQTTLLGVFVAAGDSGRVRLRDARVLHYAEYADFKVEGVAFLFFYDGTEYSADSSGEKTLFLLSVDERDADTVREARGTEAQGGGAGGGTTITPPPIPVYLPLLKGRKATSVDGVLVSDWTDLTPEELEEAVYGVQAGIEVKLGFTNYETDANLKIVKEIRTSFVFDLNRFLVPGSRARLIHWDSY